MGQIIRYCRTLCEERDIDFLVLVPTDNDLYKYFSRFGFRANFYLKTTQLDREQLLAMVEKMELPEEEASEAAGFVPVEMHAARVAALKGGSHVEFDRPTLQCTPSGEGRPSFSRTDMCCTTCRPMTPATRS